MICSGEFVFYLSLVSAGLLYVLLLIAYCIASIGNDSFFFIAAVIILAESIVLSFSYAVWESQEKRRELHINPTPLIKKVEENNK